MGVSLPYLVSLKNIPILFEKIASAKVPEKFTHQFLNTTIGLKATNDRALIPFLRNLGFLDQSGTPTAAYRLLKSNGEKPAAIAAGVRRAYQPLFDSDVNANKLSGEKLKGLVAQIAGTDDDLTKRIAGTFGAIVKLGDFDEVPPDESAASKKKYEEASQDTETEQVDRPKPKGLRTEFHYNIQVHLPSNGTEETYLNIFNAVRKTFQ